MKLIKTSSGFGDSDARRNELFKALEPFKGKRVYFRGLYENRCFSSGYLRDFSGDTVTFWNGMRDSVGSQDWIYPYWEVLVAVPE